MAKKWFENDNLRLTLPLVILYVIGIAGFWAPNFVPPIAAFAKRGVNEQWLGFFGNIVGAIFTILAALIAWLAVQGQIRAQAKALEDARARKEFAARAVLPLSLSALHQFAAGCVAALESLPDPVIPGTTLKLPTLPVQDVQEIRDALEHMGDEPARQLAETLQFLQIQQARLRDFEEKAFEGSLHFYTIQRRMIDTLDLVALIDRSFTYARGVDYRAPQSLSDELQTAFYTNMLNDTDYPLVMREIADRSEAERRP